MNCTHSGYLTEEVDRALEMWVRDADEVNLVAKSSASVPGRTYVFQGLGVAIGAVLGSTKRWTLPFFISCGDAYWYIGFAAWFYTLVQFVHVRRRDMQSGHDIFVEDGVIT